MRIDLDPSPGVTFDMTREAAAHTRDLLAELGMLGFPKTTGSKGIHIYVRVEPGWDSFAVRGAVVALGRILTERHPDLITDKWWKEERGERVFVDFNQNAPHKNMFGAWGVRPAGRGPGVDAVPLGRTRHDRSRDLHDRHRPRPTGRVSATRGS